MHTQEIRTKMEKDESWEVGVSELSQVIFGVSADRWGVSTFHHLIQIYLASHHSFLVWLCHRSTSWYDAQSLSITQQCHCKLAIQPDSTCFLTGSPTGTGITEKTKRWWSKLASVVHLWDNICEHVYWYVCMPCKSNYTHNPLWRHKTNYKSPSLNI